MPKLTVEKPIIKKKKETKINQKGSNDIIATTAIIRISKPAVTLGFNEETINTTRKLPSNEFS